MNDREILELAAKAARYTLDGETRDVWNGGDQLPEIFISIEGRKWNPLVDDGDAFRLAIDLGLFDDSTAYSAGAVIGIDEYAKFRRVIVEKAAESQLSHEHFHEPYWLCCGSRDKTHTDDRARSCVEAEQGRTDRCVYATASEHKMVSRK
jgi:hypothetical protein